MDAKTKDAIIESRGQSKLAVAATTKYLVRLSNGAGLVCIDLQKEPAEAVHAMLREKFGHYGVESIE